MSGSDYDGFEEVRIWPDNWQSVKLFQSLTTQWRTSMGGPTGLDYAVLPAVMQLHGIRKKDRADLFDCIRVMENAALSVIHEKD